MNLTDAYTGVCISTFKDMLAANQKPELAPDDDR